MSPTDKMAIQPKSGATEASAIPVIDSRELFQGSRQVQILHAGRVYVLRQTRDNKLILTK